MSETISTFMEKEINQGNIPGAVIHISREGETVFEKAYGFRTSKPKQVEMKKTTKFDLASLTKIIATLPAIMKLVEEKALSLETVVSDFFPEWKNPEKQEITIRHLLTHSSGLTAHRNYPLGKDDI